MARDNVLLTTFLEQKSEVKRHSQKVNVLVNSESDKVEDEEKKHKWISKSRTATSTVETAGDVCVSVIKLHTHRTHYI